MESINPATGESLAIYTEHTSAEVVAVLDAAAAGSYRWRRVPIGDRSSLMLEVADVLEARAGEWARLMTLETGKPILAAKAEIEKCAWVCRY